MIIIKDIEKLKEHARTKVKVLLSVAQKAYPNLSVFETLRTLERQKYLYSFGRTRSGSIKTYTLKSKHIEWKAVDLIFLDKKWNPTWKWDYWFVHWIWSMCWLNSLKWEACHLQDDWRCIINVMEKNSNRRHESQSEIEKKYLSLVNTEFRKLWF